MRSYIGKAHHWVHATEETKRRVAMKAFEKVDRRCHGVLATGPEADRLMLENLFNFLLPSPAPGNVA